jgi:hypothetical protein
MKDFHFPEEKVTLEENAMLGSMFTLDEVKEAVFLSYTDGAPRSDELFFFFYQEYWEFIAHDLMHLFYA